MELTIAYTLANRGRFIESFTSHISEFIDNQDSIIIFFDECDSTDKKIGFDGRKIFEELKKKIKRDDLEYHIPEDEIISPAFICSNDIKVKHPLYSQINKSNLKFPQGSSERYKHFRLTMDALFDDYPLFFVVQHNSAFLRPFARLKQTKEGIELLKQNKSKIGFLIRDQNTFIPGEGRLERFLRRKHHLVSITDSAKRRYRIENLEGDSGGLNKLSTALIKKGIPQYIDKHILTLGDKVESICTLAEFIDEDRFTFKSFHEDIDHMDHGLLYSVINLKS